jgi:hypothetical protein
MLLTSGGRPVGGSGELTPRRPGEGLRRVLSFVWAFLPVLSYGFLAPIPIIHAAVKLRTWTLWAASALYTAAEVLAWSATMTVTSGPVEAAEGLGSTGLGRRTPSGACRRADDPRADTPRAGL